MFFLWRTGTVQVPEHIWKQLEAPFRKIWGQIISLRIRIRIRKFFCVDPNPKKMSLDPQHWAAVPHIRLPSRYATHDGYPRSCSRRRCFTAYAKPSCWRKLVVRLLAWRTTKTAWKEKLQFFDLFWSPFATKAGLNFWNIYKKLVFPNTNHIFVF
jgi:hypothetical protein